MIQNKGEFFNSPFFLLSLNFKLIYLIQNCEIINIKQQNHEARRRTNYRITGERVP